MTYPTFEERYIVANNQKIICKEHDQALMYVYETSQGLSMRCQKCEDDGLPYFNLTSDHDLKEIQDLKAENDALKTRINNAQKYIRVYGHCCEPNWSWEKELKSILNGIPSKSLEILERTNPSDKVLDETSKQEVSKEA